MVKKAIKGKKVTKVPRVKKSVRKSAKVTQKKRKKINKKIKLKPVKRKAVIRRRPNTQTLKPAKRKLSLKKKISKKSKPKTRKGSPKRK